MDNFNDDFNNENKNKFTDDLNNTNSYNSFENSSNNISDNNYNNTNEQSFVFVNNDTQNQINKPVTNWQTVEYTQPMNDNEPKKKKRRGKVAALVAGALVCAVIGGGVGAGTLYYLEKGNGGLTASGSGSTAIKNVTYDPPKFSSSTTAMSVTDVVKKVSPAVVTVSTKSVVSSQNFFGQQQQQQQEGVGTGFIINEQGYILTNYHVVSGAAQVKVTLSDGKELNAKVLNYDQNQDLAVVKVTDNFKVPAIAELGDSDALQSGEEVIAIGNPLGKEFVGTVTKGIISSTARTIDISGTKATYLQTDAAINPGNSGGPLINSKGQVIGINTAKTSETGVEGIGFAIPINHAKDSLDSLSKPKIVIGIGVKNVTEDDSKAYNLPVGVYVTSISDFSSAQKAGIQTGDIITKFEGKQVKTIDELNKLRDTHKAGDKVSITVVRDGKEVNLQLTLQTQ
ncbi:trypsin-like peptidase domain-containing protein [Clostridium sp. YIM B02505]|uniref:Trypsin-like peptidase domain-containing protein n=1 Tax=Clostridium yunnanense TaxID=2800325 RepID=A0ABS1EQD0_9CLOT|nr:trypsin-like peptidase domain-containing protein [Clostridium yunnanense]MBK1811571.1 trypsin-like peptidase domain-containing protein [Clostridium yunnanense]